jgi:hypothetical protein
MHLGGWDFGSGITLALFYRSGIMPALIDRSSLKI